MLTPLLAYQLLVLAILLALLALVIVNLRVLPMLQKHGHVSSNPAAGPDGQHHPSLAVLIPARNEEANIGPCLQSLLSQDYPNYQVWLYDDASSDQTLTIATRIAEAHDSKLKTQNS